MRSISELRAAVTAYASEFDASAVTVDGCRRVVADVTVMIAALETVRAEAAARVAASGTWKDEGDRSPAHQLARETGTTVGAARELLETGERLRELPQLAEVAKQGALSPAQVSAVASVGVVAPDLVPAFVARARDTTVAELREECARSVAVHEPDPEDKRRRIREHRSLRTWTAASGAGVLQLTDAPDVIAGVMAHLGPAREALFHQARQRGARIRPDALDADALVATITGAGVTPADHTGPLPHRCAPRAKVLVRIDFDALLRGRPVDGEVCEIAGYGPIAVSTVRDMLRTGDAFLAAVVTKGQQVVGVAHVGRKALGPQQTALEWINPTCAADGCTQTARLEIDHRRDWAHTKLTLTDLLDRLCDHHHDLKTYNEWALVDGHGKRQFVPPTHPRHPRHQRARGDPLAG